MTRSELKIGVLALQGDFEAHLQALKEIGIPSIEIRDPARLGELDGLIIPGGESTTLLKLLGCEGMEAIRRFGRRGGVVLGTCAGLILLAHDVRDPAQESLGLLDATVTRNAYGRQVESFHAVGQWEGEENRPLEMTFIRAPRIQDFGGGVTVLARFKGEPVMIRQNRILGATFHPELTADRSVHALFVQLAHEAARAPSEKVKEAAEPCQQ
ncbi:MAG: pyridoxal 5'-phosphate synthase glutaminase subunit PdxT [Candidatus Eisenbacteria bacterium]|uniref:Pyridoxal 5'-phosphate synthase subunit PdxT n=1 Tax=Eiseniibacteriota bacterium TaxID=2212470 RepID=A0A948S054_UNCEI|nr:pyridoxal 5'-phosphate synthase glutaminase subunit PdxT [Candidatus Eisenbacteria bacterium]MBU1950885.1 pyridoxal 5'-phosphate synthase glutaminase subunit PdxT [Candidatus Eisenbacteria bacterium]MBU2692863.1 pyridoxal 5'-phosphate synthase glutaminase subunit PdxT [Candidatus Eisenbacteria bacterium]